MGVRLHTGVHLPHPVEEGVGGALEHSDIVGGAIDVPAGTGQGGIHAVHPAAVVVELLGDGLFVE